MDIINEGIYSFVDELINRGLLNPYDYIGYSQVDVTRRCSIVVGEVYSLDVEFVPNEKDNGDYDGIEGFNIK